MSYFKTKPVRSKKLRESARGKECEIRQPGVCNGNPETTVLAHVNGGGIGTKASDLAGAYSCSDCHAWLDGGYVRDGYAREERDHIHLQAVIRTQQIMFDDGLITVSGAA